MRKQINIVLASVAAVLIVAGVSIARQSLHNPLATASSVTGDLLVIAAVNLLFLMYRHSVVIDISSLPKRLVRFGWTAFLLTAFILAAAALSGVMLDTGIEAGTPNVISNNILIVSFILFASCCIAVYILVQLYGFILIKRARRTKNLFWVFYASLTGYILFSIFSRHDAIASGFSDTGSGLKITAAAFGVASIFFMVLVAYRNAWMNYLNRRQKIVTLVLSVALLAAAQIADNAFGGSELLVYMRGHSMAAGIFFNMIKYFLEIYFFLAVVSLLLHLPTAGIFDKKVRQLTSLYDISSAITASLNFEKLLEITTQQIRAVIDVDSAWMMMKNKKSGAYELSASVNVPASLLQIIRSPEFGDIIGKIAAGEKTRVYNALQQEKQLALNRNVKRSGNSLIGVPLISHKQGALGILFAYKAQDYAFDQEDARLLEAFANQTTIAIENSLLLDESLEKERLQNEMDVARDIQLKLLPKEIPYIGETIKLEAVSIPAHEVGGDYYDFIQIGESKWAVFIGDVSGKSVSAALYMAEVKGIIQALARLYTSPRELLKKVNETLYTNIDRKSFISLLAAVVDMASNTVVFTRAGHTPMGYYDPRAGEWKFLQPAGIGLGLDKGKIFDRIVEEQSISIEPGAILFMYTDGATEVFDENGEEFGSARLLNLLEHCQKNSVENFSGYILGEINAFTHKVRPDDITMIVLKFG